MVNANKICYVLVSFYSEFWHKETILQFFFVWYVIARDMLYRVYAISLFAL